jgi:hypothetical protein
MGLLSFFSSQKISTPPPSPLYENLKEFAYEQKLDLYENMTLYHRQKHIDVALFLFNIHYGIYLFERVNWRFETIKNASVMAATPDKKERDLALDARHTFMRRKFNEILHTDGCPVSNFALMEYLNESEFDQLDESFHKLMPKSRIIFADTPIQDIQSKLSNALPKTDKPLERTVLLGALFFHIGILPDNLNSDYHLLTKTQTEFINNDLPLFSTMSGPYGSGKSTLLLQKAIYELLRQPTQNIMIIMPTLAACDLLKKRMLEIVEYFIIDIELTSIVIITPQQVITQHYQKLYKKEAFTFAKLTPKMFSHRHKMADIILVDDAYLIDEEFVSYLKYQQKQAHLCLVNDDPEATYRLENSFRSPHSFLTYCSSDAPPSSKHLHVRSGNPYMHIMLILGNELKTVDHSQILIVVPHFSFAQKLIEEINGFYDTVAAVYQSDDGLLGQQLDHILIALAGSLSHLQRQYVIVVKNHQVSPLHFCHALGRASQSLYIIEDEDNEKAQEDIKMDAPI